MAHLSLDYYFGRLTGAVLDGLNVHNRIQLFRQMDFVQHQWLLNLFTHHDARRQLNEDGDCAFVFCVIFATTLKVPSIIVGHGSMVKPFICIDTGGNVAIQIL